MIGLPGPDPDRSPRRIPAATALPKNTGCADARHESGDDRVARMGRDFATSLRPKWQNAGKRRSEPAGDGLAGGRSEEPAFRGCKLAKASSLSAGSVQ